MSQYSIRARATELRAKHAEGSISPEEVGGLFVDLVDSLLALERDGATLGIRKVYPNIEAMRADTPPTDSSGRPLRRGNLVAIYDEATAATDTNSGLVCLLHTTGWVPVARIGSAMRHENTAIEQRLTRLEGTIQDVLMAKDGELERAIQSEIQARTTAITTLSEAIGALQSQTADVLADEARERREADTSLEGLVTAEQEARVRAISDLEAEVEEVRSDLETALGKEVEARTELSERVSKVEQGVTGGGGYYNVTTKHPLSSGYYTLETAISALVRGGEVTGDKRKGLIITIETSEGKWVDYRYSGDASDEQFGSTPMWQEHTALKAIVVDGTRHTPIDGVITLEGKSIDVAQSVDDSDRPVSSAAVKAELDQIKGLTLDADTEQTDEGTQVTLSNQGRQVAQFVVAGGGGSGATGTTTKAVVVAQLSASRVKLGDEVRLTYGYTHYSDGVQDGVASTLVMTIRRGAQTIATESLGAMMSGETREIGLGRYLTSADSYSISITATYEEDGETKRRVATAQLSVVSLSIALYNRSEIESYIAGGGYKDGDTANIVISVRGGAKQLAMYIDGDDDATEVKVLSGSGSRQTFILPVRTLRPGAHSLQFVASIDGLTSNSIYIDILKSGAGEAFVGLIFSRSDGRIFGLGETPEVLARQYEATSWDYIAIGRGAGVSSLTLEQPSGSTTFVAPRSYQTLTSRYTHRGVQACAYKLGSITRSFAVSVVPTSLAGIGIKEGARMELLAVGRSNAEATPAEWRSNGISTSFEGVDWRGSGWTGEALRLLNGAKAVIGYNPFATDAKMGGLTISMEVRMSNARSTTGSVISCYDAEGVSNDGFGGLIISPSAVKMPTGGRVEFVSEDGDTITRELGLNAPMATGRYYNVVLVVHPSSEHRNIRLYIDGGLSKADTYQDTIFQQRSPQGITLDSTHADLEVRHVRVWETALTDDEVLQNYITDRPTLSEMETLRERNDVLDELTGDISWDKLYKAGKGVISITMEDGGGIERLWGKSTDTKTNYRVAELIYRSPYGRAYDLRVVNAVMRRQGTSTSTYPLKNLRAYLSRVPETKVYRNIGTGQEDVWVEVEDRTYVMRPGAKPMSIINLKVDFADSSMLNNTEGAKLWDRLSRSVPSLKTPGMQADPEARAAIDGIPVSLFTSDTPDGPKRYCGQYQLNNDKSKSGYLFGQTKSDGSEIALEGINNTNSVGNFRFDGDVEAQLARTDADGFDASFEFLYPERDYTWATAPSNVKQAVVRLCKFVHDCRPAGVDPTAMTEREVKEAFRSDKFRREVGQYFAVDNLCAWWVWTDYMMAVDQRVKNTFWRTWDGQVWSLTYYDGDTSWRLRNDAFLAYDYNTNRDSWDAQRSKYAFEGHSSILWALVIANLESDIKRVATEMRRVLTDDVVRKAINSPHDHWSEREYNKSMINKYIVPTYTNYNGGGAMNYIFALNGTMQASKEDNIQRRFSLLDARYNPDDMVRRDNIPCYVGKGSVATTMVVHSGDEYYFGWATQNGAIRQYERIEAGGSLTLNYPDAISQNDPVRIAGASRIIKLDLASTAPYMQGAMNLNGCTMLSELIAPIATGRGTQWYPLLGKISGLRHIDLTGQSGITGTEDEQARTFDVSSHTGLRELKLSGTSVRAVRIGAGSPLVRLELPSTLTTLQLRALPQLSMSGVMVADWTSITTLEVAGCPMISWRELVDRCTRLERLRVEGVDIVDDGSLLRRLLLIKGVDASGAGVDTCELVGVVQLTKYIEEEEMRQWQRHYPSLDIRQPEYTILEFDEGVTDPASISNLDNSTGYKFGVPYVPSAHVKAILNARVGVVGKQATDGVMSVYPLHRWDFGKFADSTSHARATSVATDGTDGDFYIYEPEYWYKGVNDYRGRKNYACFAYGRRPSDPDPDLVKVIRYEDMPVRLDGKYIALGGDSLNTSLRDDAAYRTYKVDVTGYKRIRAQISRNNKGDGAVFLDAEDRVLRNYSVAPGANDIVYGMTVIHDIPDGAVSFAFGIERLAEAYAPYVVLSNSDKIEDLEPEWVHHKPVLVGMFKGQVIDGSFRSCLTPEGENSPSYGMDINAWMGLARQRNIKIVGYDVMQCITHMALLEAGTKNLHKHYGNISVGNWTHNPRNGMLMHTGMSSATRSDDGTQAGYYLLRDGGVRTFAPILYIHHVQTPPPGKVMGYEQLFVGKPEWVGDISQAYEIPRSIDADYNSLAYNVGDRVMIAHCAGSGSTRHVTFGRHIDLRGIMRRHNQPTATDTTGWCRVGSGDGRGGGQLYIHVANDTAWPMTLSSYTGIGASMTARPMFDGQIVFVASLDEYKQVISKY